MADDRVSRETTPSEGASAVPPRQDSRGARGRPLPSVPLPSPPLARALCRSVVGGAHLSPGVGAAGGGDARSHGEDGFVLGRDRGCDGRPAVHRALRCASGAARFVENVLTGGCGRAGHGPSLPLKRARGNPENAAVEQAGCRGWVPPPPTVRPPRRR